MKLSREARRQTKELFELAMVDAAGQLVAGIGDFTAEHGGGRQRGGRKTAHACIL
jgi:hypothetical protein